MFFAQSRCYNAHMRLYFIRHGEPDYQNDSLTKIGQRQAEKLAGHIHELKLDEIYSSPLGRAWQTAACSAEKLGIKLQVLPWLRELRWGDYSGDAYSTASPWSINDRFIAERHSYPSGEAWKTDEAVKNDRIVQDVAEICASFDAWLKVRGFERCGQLYKVAASLAEKQRNVAFFCHGGVATALVSHLLNIPFWQMIAHAGVELTSITCIEIAEASSVASPADAENAANAGKAHFAAARLVFYGDIHHLKD